MSREARLDALRDKAAREGRVDSAGVPAAGGPMPPAPGYYGQPLLKPPVWTWEVPAYFFLGGAAGIAAAIAFVAGFTGDVTLARHARGVALAGALLSPALLVSDLGRPGRFLNMLRVFKRQSVMSVGAWTLVLFSTAIGAAVALRLVSDTPPAVLLFLTDAVAALSGLVLATYTGVLLGVTAIPVWAAHARLLPVHFSASSLGAAVGMLELIGHVTPAMNLLGIAAAATEVVLAVRLEIRRERVARPLRHGRSGWLVRAADVLSGPVPLALRLAAASSPPARMAAALSGIVGSLLTRYGWVAAGRASAADVELVLTESRAS